MGFISGFSKFCAAILLGIGQSPAVPDPVQLPATLSIHMADFFNLTPEERADISEVSGQIVKTIIDKASLKITVTSVLRTGFVLVKGTRQELADFQEQLNREFVKRIRYVRGGDVVTGPPDVIVDTGHLFRFD